MGNHISIMFSSVLILESFRRSSVSVDPELVQSYVQSLVVTPASPQGSASQDLPPSYENLVFEPSNYPKEVTETPPPCYEEVVMEKERL